MSIVTRPGPLPRRDVSAGGAWLAGCVAAFVALCAALHSFVADDAYISLRYAENLAWGNGFGWNPGGPRVEGFSNPLLVITEALAMRLGIGGIDTARLLGVGAGLALLLLVHRRAPALVGPTATRVALALIALFPPFALWAVGGLETLPAALAITVGVLALCRRAVVPAAVAFAVLPWLRPEGLAVALAVVAAARLPHRRALAVAVAPIASQTLLEIGRLAVYGHLLPNSALYKTAAGGTFDVIAKFAPAAAPVMVGAVAGALLARGRARLLAVPPLVYLLGSLRMLDSADAFGRFMLPTWPQWALLAGLAAAHVRPRRGLAALAAIVALAGALDLYSVTRFDSRYAACEVTARTGAADWLRTHTPPGTTFSVSDAGLVAERADRAAIDQFSLNEPVIRRTAASRAARVLGLRPDVLVIALRYATDRAIEHGAGGYRRAAVFRGAGAGCNYELRVLARGAPDPLTRSADSRRRR